MQDNGPLKHFVCAVGVLLISRSVLLFRLCALTKCLCYTSFDAQFEKMQDVQPPLLLDESQLLQLVPHQAR